MSTVEMERLSKSYGSHVAIHDLTLSIGDGEFVALVGPSGCGKSTLLRMVAGLEDISGGDLLIGDRRVNAMPPKLRDIAMVFQSYALYPQMTVRENMGFALRMAKFPKLEIEERVNKAARMLGLDALLDRLPKQLSGGQRQRVAMGRAIVRNPTVFLFDEPLSNLDAKLRVQMRFELKELHQRLNTTTIYVTHDQIEAMTLADRVVVMNAGRIEQVGSPLELYDTPQSLFVATFIGSPTMNLIEGVVDATGTTILLPTGAALAVAMERQLIAGMNVTLGVRPEHLSLGEGPLEATVLVVEPTGPETQVSARLGNSVIRFIVKDRPMLSPGDVVTLNAPEHRLHLFQTGSRQRL